MAKDEKDHETQQGSDAPKSNKKQALLMVVLAIVVFALLLAFYFFKLNPVEFKYQGY